MNTYLTAASAFALSFAAPAMAQTMTPGSAPMSSSMTGMMTEADVGVSPMASMPATDYVKMAADSDMYEIASSRLALTKSRNAATRNYAQMMIRDHTGTTRSLTAALKNADRTIAKPSTRMSDANNAKIALLRRAPRDGFDTLYMQQQMDSHKMAWSLHKGYAVNGTDPALKQVASTAVPIVEGHITNMRGMMPANMTSGM